MKRSKIIFLVVAYTLCIAWAELQGPPSDSEDLKNSFKDRKSNLMHDENSNSDNKNKNDENDDETSTLVDAGDDESSIASLLAEEFSYQGSAIKIIKAPDFTQEKEAQKMTEMLSTLVNSHAKLIKKLEDEIQEMDGSIASLGEQPELVQTQEEIELEILYESAMKILNRTRSDKQEGFALLKKAADKGHQRAQAKIAWAQLMGNHVEMDFGAARETFLKLADTGLPDAHMGLGFMYAAGIGFNVSQSKALLHYTVAALGDNTWAQMALGYRYWSGISLANSCEKALEFYRKVATKVASQITFSGGAAVHRVRLLDEVETSGSSSAIFDNDLLEYYQLLAGKGDVQAQVGLGQLHYQGGRGIALDHQKALSYFTQAANAGNAVAMAFLGKIYLEGSENIKADNETAFKYFKKAADLGNPVGQSGLGIMYLQGKGVPKDTAKALSYFTKAADQGWVDGQLQLGNMYFSGIGVKRDFMQANKYFNLASQSGHVLAYYNLGQMHAVGLGMMRSCPTAVELFKSVAERGKWSEILMFAHQDYKSYRFNQAFMKYALASELGYEVAQSNAAFMLDRNEVTLFKSRHEDLVRALQYWSRSASQGYSTAQVKMGDYHYYGLGTEVDYDTAASHYRMASEQQHNAQAMFNLAYMHEQGLGMKKDWHLAKRFYDLASETSVDAKVPVALAILKLSFMFKVESMKDSPLNFLFELDKNIASNWDLYLITIFTILLGTIFYFRRPPQHVEREHPRSLETPTSTVSQPASSTTTESQTATATVPNSEATVNSDQ
ncbi:protein sel-1 homolog 1 [Contarinia nasturtii]|uniref:protein sel-1 homolog 1 n=1 Tax=Contarinia nasturtii TaxID=265458 RepID=UPI0012D4B6AB|nr:protein sel-1 homolog 1 [Contarinia nasturtii]